MKKLFNVAATALLGLSLAACSSTTNPTSSKAASTSAKEEMTGGKIKFAVVYGAAHGDKALTTAAVAVNAEDGTIVGAFLDEYQYLDATKATGVPNSDKGFGESYADGVVFASKRVNTTLYSGMIKEKAGGKNDYKANQDAIVAYAVGKKEADLQDVKLDAVSGSTLADSPNYLKLIGEGAKAASASAEAYEVKDLANVKVTEAEFAAHGEKSFALVANVMEGNTVVTARIDEFQYLPKDGEGVVGVPNSDKGFVDSVKEGVVLGSKKQNNDYYSALMASKAGATTKIADSFAAIEAYVSGKSVDDLKKATDGADPKAFIDTVTGSTLADTMNYVLAVVNAATNSK